MGVKSREPTLKYSNSDVINDVNNLFQVYNIRTRYTILVIRVELPIVHFEHPDEPACKVTDRSLYKLELVSLLSNQRYYILFSN